MSSGANKGVEVVAGVLQKGNPVTTLGVRKSVGECAGYWEFPGGKREKHESLTECLRRELSEELGINAEIGEYVGLSEFATSSSVLIRLHAFYVNQWSGEIRLTEHDASVWLPHTELLDLNWSAGDIPLVKQVVQLHYNAF